MSSISGHASTLLQSSYFMPTSPMSHTPNVNSQYYAQQIRQSPPYVQLPANSSMSSPSRYHRKTEECEPMSTSPINFQHGTRDYLPSFLTGESQQSSSISKGMAPATPERHRRISMPFSSEPTPTSSEKGNQQQKEEPVIGKQGPPTSGIGRVNESMSGYSLYPMTPVGSRRSLNTSTGFIPSIVPTPKSVMRSSFSGTTNPPSGSTSWVTVFGFSSSSIANVLAHFSQFGTILEWKTNPGSNWIHLNYSNPVEARRALQKNGTVIAGMIMVGVSPCSEKMARESLPPGASSFFQASPLSVSTSSGEIYTMKENECPIEGNSAHTSNTSGTPVQQHQKSGMRPLGREAAGLQLPQQRGGFMSWALDAIFGW